MATATLKCRNCKDRKPRESMVKVPLGAFCDYSCASEYGIKKSRDTREKQAKKKQRAEKKQFKDNDLPHQIQLTRFRCNEMVRWLDRGLSCISCSKPWADNFHAGHFLSVGAHPEIRFDPRNIHGQCPGCNIGSERRKAFGRTVANDYRVNLIARHGEGLMEWLDGPHPVAKLKCHDLQEMRKVFCAETKRLKAGLSPSKNWR